MTTPRPASRRDYRAAAAVLSLFTLSACGPSDAERATVFKARCDAANFTPAQCVMLWQIAEKASDDAASASLGSSLAIGLAIGNSTGGRR